MPIILAVGLLTFLMLWAVPPHFPFLYFIGETTSNTIGKAQSYYYHGKTNLNSGHLIGIILLSIYKGFMINFGLKIYDQQKNNNLSLSDFLNLDFDILSYLIARLRFLFTAIAGIVLFIVPGLVWIPRYYFSHYFIIDRKSAVGESFAASSLLTTGVKPKLWLFMIIKGLFYGLFTNLAPLSAIILYLVVYVPISILSKISIYRQLLTPKQIT